MESGITFAVIESLVEFDTGSPDEKHAGFLHEDRQRWRMPRTYAISTHEITVDEYMRVVGKHVVHQNEVPGTHLMQHLSWGHVVKYCRMPSEQTRIPDDQMCHPEVTRITGNTIVNNADDVSATVYPLLAAAEWGYACRVGTTISRSFGDHDRRLASYAWYDSREVRPSHPVGLLKTNNFGLFDMHRNVAELRQTWGFFEGPLNPDEGEVVAVDGAFVDGTVAKRGNLREDRGGSYGSTSEEVCSSYRDGAGQGSGLNQISLDFDIGFRIARTIETHQ